MKTINIEASDQGFFIGFRVKNYADFDSVVNLAGIYTKKVTEEEVRKNFHEALMDRLYKTDVWQKLNNSEECDFKSIHDLITRALNSVEIPTTVVPYEQTVYLSLDKDIETLHYTDQEDPTYALEVDLVWPTFINYFESWIQEQEAAKAEAEQQAGELEAKKQQLVEKYKKAYDEAGTKSAKDAVVDEFKIVMKKNAEVSLSKAEATYMLKECD